MQQKQYVGNIWIDILSNIFLLNIAVVLPFKHIVKELKNGTEILACQAVLELLIQTVFCTFWPVEIWMTLLSFSDNLLQETHIIFLKKKKCWLFWDSAQNMLKFV